MRCVVWQSRAMRLIRKSEVLVATRMCGAGVLDALAFGALSVESNQSHLTFGLKRWNN